MKVVFGVDERELREVRTKLRQLRTSATKKLQAKSYDTRVRARGRRDAYDTAIQHLSQLIDRNI